MDALAEGTITLLDDAALRERLAARAYQIAVERYSYEAYVQRTDTAYRRLASPAYTEEVPELAEVGARVRQG